MTKAAPYLMLLALCLGFITHSQAANLDTKIARCAFCHGADGVSQNPIWPSLAGLDADYLERRLLSYMAGENSAPAALQMRYVLRPHSAEDIQAIAEHYAGLKPARPQGKANLAGAALYHEGFANTLQPCASCHGARAEGIAELQAPRLAGQSARYTLNQLNAYAAGQRPDNDSAMAFTSRTLSAKQRAALAAYLQSLAPKFEGKLRNE